MPKPMAICIEDLEARADQPKFLRCVAVPGRQPGLRVDRNGKVLWQSEDGVSCELWVSGDDRLILYRPEDAVPVTLHRAGRRLEVPGGKPVVLIDQDEFEVGARHLRVHVHGEAPAVSPPSVFVPKQKPLAGLARAAAVAATIGAVAVGGCGKKDPETRGREPIEIRDQPPKVEASDPPQEQPVDPETPGKDNTPPEPPAKDKTDEKDFPPDLDVNGKE